MRLEDMKMIVTGAAQGLGRHYAIRLAEAGAQVAAGDVNEAGLASLAEETRGLRGRVHTRRLDVASEADVQAFVDFSAEAMGGLNGLVNNAGILRDGLLVRKDRASGAITKLSRADWQAVIDINLTGATLIVRDVVARMAAAGDKGVIVNMSSIARHGNRGQSNYAAAKSALATNTKTWSLEFAPFGIRVGAVAPGMIPVGRCGLPEDIWLAVKFVIECDYFNGRTIDVDGGLAF